MYIPLWKDCFLLHCMETSLFFLRIHVHVHVSCIYRVTKTWSSEQLLYRAVFRMVTCTYEAWSSLSCSDVQTNGHCSCIAKLKFRLAFCSVQLSILFFLSFFLSFFFLFSFSSPGKTCQQKPTKILHFGWQRFLSYLTYNTLATAENWDNLSFQGTIFYSKHLTDSSP